MFAYSGNNPINRVDYQGMLWKEIGAAFAKAWSGIKTWAKNTFGAGLSTTMTIDDSNQIIGDPMPITISTGVENTTVVLESGDSSKPISVYANKEISNPLKSSSAGLKINTDKFELDISLGLDNIGVSGSISDGAISDSFGLRLNLSELKFGIEKSTTQPTSIKGNTTTTYVSGSVNGSSVIAVIVFIKTGQIVPVAQSAY